MTFEISCIYVPICVLSYLRFYTFIVSPNVYCMKGINIFDSALCIYDLKLSELNGKRE